jgi:hypothetical protein
MIAAQVAMIVAAGASDVNAAPLLPDLIAWESGPPENYMRNGSMLTVDNKVRYRYSQPIANIGSGPLELREDTDANFVQDIYQRIYDSAGGNPSEVFVGTFPNAHPPYGHLFLVGIAEYRIRTVTSGMGVGPTVASQTKTSYGLYDFDNYNTSPPGASHYGTNTPCPGAPGEYCLGISVGWADVYPLNFPGQYVEVTGLPDGQYWLEAEIDPNDVLQESNETNNITRVLVDLVVPGPEITPGDYNRDGVVNAADYVVWRKTLNQNVERRTGADGDGNGVIGMPDLEVWQAFFGDSMPGGGSSSVPEPAAGLMLLSLCACWRLSRRRRTRL